MQLIIRNKNDHKIIYQKNIDDLKDFNLKQDFPNFDSEIMEWGWINSSILPLYFKINKDNKLEELPFTEAVFIDDIYYPLGYKTIGNQVVTRTVQDLLDAGVAQLYTPFEYFTRNGTIATRTLQQVLQQKALDSREACQNYLARIEQTIEQEILAKYSLFKQLTLTQGYLAWMRDQGEKARRKDPRQVDYEKMEADIQEIREKYQPMIQYANQQLVRLAKEEKSISEKNTVKEIKAHLKEKEIPFTAKETKAQLLQKIKNLK